MQNAAQDSTTDCLKIEKVNVERDIGNLPSTPNSTNSSPAKSETETYSERRRFMSDSSESEEDSGSEVESFVIDQEFEEDPKVETAKFLLSPEEDRSVDLETQARLEAVLQAAGISQLAAKDGKHLADPEVLRRLTSSVSCALDEAAAALTRMRTDNPRNQPEKTSLVEACTDGDVGTVRKLLTEGRSVHETSEEGESLLSLACSAGYFELAQVLLAMHANVEDRGIKGECTPLMEAASAGHLDIVRLLVAHGADVNAQSSSGNTPLMYGCAGGHTEVVKFLLEHGANVEDHNENGHTPLMEAASAGHVELAKILLMHGAGINTHSNEFKETALTLACYKGHLDMVRFLLEAGADQEHKTDEMHTALMEASMDGHVEVARLLLDSGAQVNMPADSFESPLTLAACGGHVDLAMLLIERGANIEEVNDEGYTPLMEAAREGHEEMVALLLSQGANINAQTDETQETALTLACCGGFSEVADFLIKAGADIELGASTPLMEAAQEGHLELVKYLLENNANVRAQTQTGDTALTYACENGHTDVADLLLQYCADLEHESEGGRTPLMKACRAGHLCTVQFLITKGADVNRQTSNNDHTPLSLACAGGHLPVVELLLAHGADPNHKLKDNSTMLIEAAKGGHTTVVQLLLDFPHSVLLSQQGSAPTVLPGNRDSPIPATALPPNLNFYQPPPTITSPVLQEVPEAVRIVSEEEQNQNVNEVINNKQQTSPSLRTTNDTASKNARKSGTPKRRTSVPNMTPDIVAENLEKIPNLSDLEDSEFLNEDPNSGGGSIIDYIKKRKNMQNCITPPLTDDGSTQKQQILEELHQVERDFHGKQQASNLLLSQFAIPQDQSGAANATVPHMLSLEIAMQLQQQAQQQQQQQTQQQQIQQQQQQGPTCLPAVPLKLSVSGATSGNANTVPAGGDATSNFNAAQAPSAYYFAPLHGPIAVPNSILPHPKFPTVAAHAEVSQNTAISDRPKAKPVSKKEGKNLRKQQQQQQQQPPPQPPQQQVSQDQQQQQQYQTAVYTQQQSQLSQLFVAKEQQQQQQQQQQTQISNVGDALNIQNLDIDSLDQDALSLKSDEQSNLLTASILQQFHNSQQISTIRAAFVGSPIQQNRTEQKTCVELYEQVLETSTKAYLEQKNRGADAKTTPFPNDLVDDVQSLDSYEINDFTKQVNNQQHQQQQQQHKVQIQPYTPGLEESVLTSLTAQHELTTQTDGSRIEYFIPANSAQLPVQVQHTLYPYDHYLQAVASMSNKDQTGVIYQAGFHAGMNIVQQQLASSGDTLTTGVPTSVVTLAGSPASQPYVAAIQSTCTPVQACHHVPTSSTVPTSHHCQVPCANHQHLLAAHQQQQQQQQQHTHQVQAATQTPQPSPLAPENRKQTKVAISSTQENVKVKKNRLLLRNQANGPQTNSFPQNQGQNFQIDANAANQQCVGAAAGGGNGGTVQQPALNYCMDLDSETESNHDTALTLACAGGHEELVELLIRRGADKEHRDKKGFTPLILAATAGHDKVVEILLNNGADIEAQSERTKDTPLSLACSGGRYEVVELLLNRGANKEHRNVSDYTPLSLAASGGYVNIIKLLLNHGAEINSRTGSKLGISPLMLAAMNGHTAAVKLLLDCGSDINAQIETNRNTALTLACFQGRHEVVSLLLDRKANVEHRAKTGLTPLMEAASGGYVEVGRVLLDKGADVNAAPVPSSRDTALTIAADKGHCRFVELLLCRGAAVEVKNKKGNSPLWLAANGGHLSVVELLYNLNADIDSQDNRKVSCLMAAFRKGHVKVVKWMVNHVTQFPSDQEMIRYISTISDKELLEKCQECVKVIRAAKETQAAKANKNASILLEELDMEKNREESKKAAAARRRERKKKKKLEKREEKRKLNKDNQKNDDYYDNDDKKSEENDKGDDDDVINETSGSESPLHAPEVMIDKEEGDSGIDANSQGSCSSNEVKTKEKRKDKKKKKTSSAANKKANKENINKDLTSSGSAGNNNNNIKHDKVSNDNYTTIKNSILYQNSNVKKQQHPAEREDFQATGNETYVSNKNRKSHGTSHDNDSISLQSSSKSGAGSSTSPKQSNNKREEGWKEVVRKSSVQTIAASTSAGGAGSGVADIVGVKKVSVPLNAISRVIGRGGSNINAIRGATGAHIEVEKQSKGQGERIITIKGSSEATKQAHILIAALIKDPDVDILQMLPKTTKTTTTATTLWDKTQIGTKKVTGKVVTVSHSTVATTFVQHKTVMVTASTTTAKASTTVKTRSGGGGSSGSGGGGTVTSSATRVIAPRLVAQAERNAAAAAAAAAAAQIANTKNTVSYTTSAIVSASGGRGSACGGGPIKLVTTSANQTFAAKLTETTSVHHVPVTASATNSMSLGGGPKPSKTATQNSLNVPLQGSTGPSSPLQQQHQQQQQQSVLTCSPKHHRPPPTASAPPSLQQFQSVAKMLPFSANSGTCSLKTSALKTAEDTCRTTTLTTQEYSLFNSMAQQPTWRQESESHKQPVNFAAVTGGGISQSTTPPKFIDNDPPPQVDASKAPGYRGGQTSSGNSNSNAMCSPVSSKTSSNSTTPPSLPAASSSASVVNYQGFESPKNQPQLAPIGTNMIHGRVPSATNNGQQQQPQQPEQHFYSNGGGSADPHLPPAPTSRSMHHLAHSDTTLYKSVSANFADSLLTMNSATEAAVAAAAAQQQQQQHLLSSYHHQQQQQHMSYSQQQVAPISTPSVTMSRLNPKAPDFASSMQQQQQQHAKQQQQQQQHPAHMFNGYQQQMTKNAAAAAIGTYHRQQQQPQPGASSPSPHNRWLLMQQPFTQQQQNELMSGMAGMTLHSIARATGGDILENGADLTTVNGSPAMSPNLPSSHNIHLSDGTGHYVDDNRKPPQPIGTERARKSQNPLVDSSGSSSWMFGNESKMVVGRPWSGIGNYDRYPVIRNQMEADYMTHPMDSYQQGLPVENPHAFSSSAPFLQAFLLQHQANMHPLDYGQPDALKMEQPPWDPRPNIADLQDKNHGWTGLGGKWNQ
ncbi:ankyrin repeat domain-containing protein 17 isoform X2 [Agrilus planipennis]|uniref:Ankyrin repeat domain-containing protein 17 isoform X2 n=1 Tax=Agrilus planipennis TaxID=224129 RepID=A0A7F5R8J3_AGRPL|nr:ankyrin repeat domain-containing protein 17 isoform X2 [Agrilus planipennis]